MAKIRIPRKTSQAYVYALVVDGVTRYIGKGVRDRCKIHVKIATALNRRRAAGEKVRTQKLYNRLAKAIRTGAVIQEVILVRGLSSEAAFEQERIFIAASKMRELWNEMPGGHGFDSEYVTNLWRDPKFRDAMSKSELARKEKLRITSAETWKDPVIRLRRTEGLRAALGTAEMSKRRSEVSKAVWQRDGYRETRDPTKRWADPLRRQKQSEAIKAKWRDPEYRARETAKKKLSFSRPEYRAKRAELTRALWLTPEYRNRVVAASAIGLAKRKLARQQAKDDPAKLGLSRRTGDEA